jgi:putative MFS transporter
MSFETMPIVVFGFLVAMFIQTFAPLLYAYTPEPYPTEIRNSGAGLVYGAGRLANTVGPLLVAFFYRHYGYTSVFVYISSCWVLVAITVGGFGLKTTGRALEQLSAAPKKAGAE